MIAAAEEAPAAGVYAAALAGAPLRAVLADGRGVALPTARWMGRAEPADVAALARVAGPVLDVGCGPGRHVAHLADLGIAVLGIDASPAAVRRARERGAPAVCGDVFGTVPGAGAWRTALVLDGNVGIGGDPVRLLRRVRELVCPGGRVVVELAPPGSPSGPVTVRLEAGPLRSAPLPWATVAADRVRRIASASALQVMDSFSSHGRWFATLHR